MENEKKDNYRLVIQVKENDHSHQVIATYPIYMELTETERILLSEIFDTSDKVISHIWGRKIGKGKSNGNL